MIVGVRQSLISLRQVFLALSRFHDDAEPGILMQRSADQSYPLHLRSLRPGAKFLVEVRRSLV